MSRCEGIAEVNDSLCPQHIHTQRISGLQRKEGCTYFPQRAWRHLQTRHFATTAVQDVDHGAAPPIKDMDWLVVEDASAEHGGVASTTTPAPTTRTLRSPRLTTRHDSIELFLARGGSAGRGEGRKIEGRQNRVNMRFFALYGVR